MKRHRFKKREYSPISMKRRDAELIRKMASNRGVTVHEMTSLIIEEWAGWKEPEFYKSIDTIKHKDYN